MLKIRQTGFLKLNFEIIPNYPVFAKHFRELWMKLKFFCQFPNLWALRVSGMGVVIPQNVKKAKITAPYSLQARELTSWI